MNNIIGIRREDKNKWERRVPLTPVHVSTLVEQHQLGSRYFYEIVGRGWHHHLVCLSCGRVFDFACPSTEYLKSRIKQEEGFKVTEADVRLSGYCPDCQQRLYMNTIDM